jgi:hypothetical protein
MIEKFMNNIKIYTATKGKKEDCILYNGLKSYNYYYDEKVCGFKVHYEENNTNSLQSCYNKFLEDARSSSTDIALFVHDDVHINTRDLYNLVSDAAEKFTVFGLAGASTCKIGKPALWHLMSDKQSQLGCVAHGTNDNYTYTSFGKVNKRALLIDGVFIGININKLPENVKFDESYPSRWHYYDLDFSLECNRNKVIIGVVDIPIIHCSPGLTNPDSEFYKGQEYFIKKWKT